MSISSRTIDIAVWVAKARSDPVLYQQRQTTEILLNAISMMPSLHQSLWLKGGILMSLVYQSPRATGDIDFTTPADPAAYVDQLRAELDRGIQRATARLGYTDLLCRVQTIKTEPPAFPEARFPALAV